MIQLNEKQTEAKDKLVSFILNSEDRAIILTGAAGTGKTRTIVETMQEFKKLERMTKLIDPDAEPINWYITATTNKAKQALKDSLKGIEVTTIHSLLGLAMRGKSLKKVRENEVLKNSVIVIDECSYIDYKLLGFINDVHGVKIIYVGDEQQLAPVRLNHSPVFKCGYEMIELTETVRAVNAPSIASYCADMRAFIKAEGKGVNLPLLLPDIAIEHLSMDDFKALTHKVFITQKQSTDDHRILAYSNAVVTAHNERLFHAENGRTDFAVGDTVLVNSYANGFKTDEQVTLQSSVVGTWSDIAGVRYQALGDVHSGILFSPYDYTTALKELEKRVYSKDYIHTKQDEESLRLLADLRPLYSCTIHKSQGSTFDTVYIDLTGFNKIRDIVSLARLLYVGISRASRKVVLTGDI